MNRRRLLVIALAVVVLVGAGIALATRDGEREPGAAGSGDGAQESQAATGTGSLEDTRSIVPAAEGSTLTSVTVQLPGMFAIADADTLKADASYTITFRPYGYGPLQGTRPTLIIRVDTASPDNDSASAMDFAGRNVLAAVAADDDEVAEGGEYAATLTFQAQGDLLSAVLRDIKRAD